jgi:acyl dehydratase
MSIDVRCGQAVDAEWLMAYAAALGEDDPRYFDTARDGGVAAHPVFPVCLEWPAWLQALHQAFPAGSLQRGVHVTQELNWHRPLPSGTMLITQANVCARRQRRTGLHVTTALTTRGADGIGLFSSRSGLLLRDVEGHDQGADSASDTGLLPSLSFTAADQARWQVQRDVPAGFAHVYSACSRICNPIHTDVAAAVRAGLPGIILHGTATLALSVSALLRHDGGDRPVRRIAARFLAPVPLPATLLVEGLGQHDGGDFAFRTFNAGEATPACIGTVSFADAA